MMVIFASIWLTCVHFQFSGAARLARKSDLASSLTANLEQDLGEMPQLAAIQEVSSSLIDTVLEEEEEEMPEAAATFEVSGSARRKEYHLVAFRYKSGVSRSDVRKKFLDLKRTCKKNGKAVISEISAGSQSSPENVGQGYTDIFMVKFSSAAEKNYYLGCIDKPCQDGGRKPSGGFCQSHDDFKVFAGPKLDDSSTVNKVKNYNAGVIVHDYKPASGGDLKGKFPHAVFFRFKSTVRSSQKAEVRTRFKALQDQCKGMKVFAAGDQNSKEGVHQNYEQGYWTVFDSKKNLDRYLGVNGNCPAHEDFKAFVGDLLLPDDKRPTNSNSGVFVFDFTDTR